MECECHAETTYHSNEELEIDTVLDYELEEILILHIFHKVVLYMSKVHLSDLTSKMLDMILQKEKTFQLRHSLGNATKKSDVLPKVVDFPCGTCGKESIELSSVETSPFEEWSVQCDKCNIWYHLVCQNLTGQEQELQPKSRKKFFCTACKGPGKGKGRGKSSTVSVTPEHNIGNVESQDGTSTESIRECGRGCHSRGCCPRSRGRPTTAQINDNDDKSTPSTSTDSIRCSSCGRQIKKRVFDD